MSLSKIFIHYRKDRVSIFETASLKKNPFSSRNRYQKNLVNLVKNSNYDMVIINKNFTIGNVLRRQNY